MIAIASNELLCVIRLLFVVVVGETFENNEFLIITNKTIVKFIIHSQYFPVSDWLKPHA